MQTRHITIIGAIIGIIIILVALRIMAAAAREAGQGSCLTGCCLFEIGESLLDMGCGLVGCGGLMAAGIVAVLVLRR